MPYRNDQEALRGRVHSLEGQLRDAREHLEQLRTPSPHDVAEPTSAPAAPSRWQTVFQTGWFTMLSVTMTCVSIHDARLGPLQAGALVIGITAGVVFLCGMPFLGR